jgi:uncharacterized membrane protein YeaQ/YmgE (transglycosylase-associated protein family)
MNNPAKLQLTSNAGSRRPRFEVIVLALVLLCAAGLGSTAPAQTASPGTSQLLASTTDEAKRKIEDAEKTAVNKIEQLWRTIDEQRLVHRTRDELVAWVIMGLLAAGLLQMVSNLKRPATLFFGLAGAFLGGIIAHVTQLNLGLGPVLIRYEDLLLSFAGALLLMFLMRSFMKRKESKPKESKG